MILGSLRVENWRCFANPVQLGPLGDGLNVIHGPNGTGKSTLMLALVRGLLDNHAVAGKAVEALRPWGRSLSPTVTIEFEHQGQRLRLVKRFLGSAMSELSRLENGQFVRWSEDDDADRQVREMLAATSPSRGVTDARHWGWAQILWAPQDGLALPELADNVRSQVRALLGAQVADSGVDALEARIRQSYEAVYTPKGKLKTGKEAPPVVRLEADLAEAQESRRKLLEQVAAFDEASRRIESLKACKQQVLRDEQQVVKNLDHARRRAQEYSALAAQHKGQHQAVEAAAARYDELKRRMEGIRAASRELTDARAILERLESDAPLKVLEVEQYRTTEEGARARRDAVRKGREDVDTARQKADHARRFVEHQQKCAEIDAMLERIAAARAELDGLQQRRAGICAPDAATLARIRDAVRDRDSARIKLEAAMITVQITAEGALELEILGSQPPDRRALAAGEVLPVQDSPQVAWRIPGVATFRATGPTGSVDQWRAKLQKAEKNLESLVEGFAARDVDELEPLHEQAVALDRDISNAKVRVETLLAGRPLEAIQQERARAGRAREDLLASHPAWAQDAPDAEALLAQAEEIELAFRASIEEAERAWEQAKNAHASATERMAAHQAELAAATRQIAAVQRRLEELTSDGQDDAQREAALRELARAWDAARGAEEEIKRQLAAFPGDPQDEVEVFQRQVDQLRKQATTATENLSKAEGQLQELVAMAPYSALAQVEEKIAALDDALARQRLANHAIRLLFETVSQCRTAAVEAVVGPVEQLATQTLQRIGGPRLGSIRFTESFAPGAVAPQAVEEPVGIDQLSGGEREQVHLAVRLALAEVLSADQRHLVVLDDVLTFTDTARLARVLTILEEAAERFQIVILTCHPERYGGLRDAKFFDLEALVVGG